MPCTLHWAGVLLLPAAASDDLVRTHAACSNPCEVHIVYMATKATPISGLRSLHCSRHFSRHHAIDMAAGSGDAANFVDLSGEYELDKDASDNISIFLKEAGFSWATRSVSGCCL